MCSRTRRQHVAVDKRDGDAPRGSKAGPLMESSRRNMRGPTGAAGLVSGGGGRRGIAEAVVRAEVGSLAMGG